MQPEQRSSSSQAINNLTYIYGDRARVMQEHIVEAVPVQTTRYYASGTYEDQTSGQTVVTRRYYALAGQRVAACPRSLKVDKDGTLTYLRSAIIGRTRKCI